MFLGFAFWKIRACQSFTKDIKIKYIGVTRSLLMGGGAHARATWGAQLNMGVGCVCVRGGGGVALVMHKLYNIFV